VRFSRRSVLALIAASGVFLSAAAVIWRVGSSADQVSEATVYAAYLAAAALAVTLLMAVGAWWQKGRRAAAQAGTPSQVAAAADRLAKVMADRWRREAIARRIVTPAPATVRWHWALDELAAPPRELALPPAPGTGPPSLPGLDGPGELLRSGVVTHLHDQVYARLPHGRLILVGGPGAGKTGAMILLLLAALDHRASLAGGRRARVPVPVWLTLCRWNPQATTLEEWVADSMNRDYPALRAPGFGPDAAGELLRSGQVALFLDGLDEMPEGIRACALRRISDEARGLRVVVTSRLAEYRHALPAGRPDNTAVIELRPVRPAEAAAYLLHGQYGPSRQRWEQLGAHLIRSPGSVVARALDNPLTLSLARDAYARKNPATLADPAGFPTVQALREHLIDQVLITAYPDERQRELATRWLSWIACHMGASRDLPWWDIPAWAPPGKLRLIRGLAGGLLVGFSGAIMIGPSAGLEYGMRAGLAFGLGSALAIGLPGGLAAGLADVPTGAPQRLAPRWLRPGELARSLLIAPLYYWPFGAWTAAIADSPSATPAGTYRADRRTGLAMGLLLGLVTGVTCGLVAGLTAGSSFRITAGYLPWLAIGTALATGLAGGLATALAGQAPLVMWSELALTRRRRPRVRFLRLLEDAAGRHVLRQAGAVYQFRHAELQDHLVAMHAHPAGFADDHATETRQSPRRQRCRARTRGPGDSAHYPGQDGEALGTDPPGTVVCTPPTPPSTSSTRY
jgi:hypothetical protein